MSIITLPGALIPAFDGGFAWGQQRYDLVSAADVSGATQVRPMGPPRWVVSMRAPRNMTAAEAALWRTYLLRGRGRVNHYAIHNIAQPAPRGTARGTMFLKVAVAAGATTATITGAGISGTLLSADALQFGTGVGTSQLVHVVQDATSSPASPGTVVWTNTAAQTVVWTNSAAQTVTWTRTGTINITFEPPARYSFPAGTVVTWDKPVAYFKSTADAMGWNYYNASIQRDLTFDGIEDWTP